MARFVCCTIVIIYQPKLPCYPNISLNDFLLVVSCLRYHHAIPIRTIMVLMAWSPIKIKPNVLFLEPTFHKGSGPVSENREQPEIRLIIESTAKFFWCKRFIWSKKREQKKSTCHGLPLSSWQRKGAYFLRCAFCMFWCQTQSFPHELLQAVCAPSG